MKKLTYKNSNKTFEKYLILYYCYFFINLFYLLFKINLTMPTGFQDNLLLCFVIVACLFSKFAFLFVYFVISGFTSSNAHQVMGSKIWTWPLIQNVWILSSMLLAFLIEIKFCQSFQLRFSKGDFPIYLFSLQK